MAVLIVIKCAAIVESILRGPSIMRPSILKTRQLDARDTCLNKFLDALEQDAFVITTELTPPKGTDLSGLFDKADMLKERVTAFNLTESHAARMAMDPVAVGRLLLDRGLEPIVQMTSRDKNRIAIQASMLGAAALGIRNLVFMGGDPPKNGDHPDAKPVFDMFASQLLEAALALNSGRDIRFLRWSGGQSRRRGHRDRNRKCTPQSRCGRFFLPDPGYLRHRVVSAIHGRGETVATRPGRHHPDKIGEDGKIHE